MTTALRVLGWSWLAAAGVVIMLGIVGTWMSGGFGAVQALLSPFNVAGWLAVAVTIAPGWLLLTWASARDHARKAGAVGAPGAHPS